MGIGRGVGGGGSDPLVYSHLKTDCHCRHRASKAALGDDSQQFVRKLLFFPVIMIKQAQYLKPGIPGTFREALPQIHSL